MTEVPGPTKVIAPFYYFILFILFYAGGARTIQGDCSILQHQALLLAC
jgi:hypothetical protein